MLGSAEQLVFEAVQWLRLSLETIGALVVAVGAIRGVADLVRSRGQDPAVRFIPVRLTLARYLSVALEFQLASDILSTSIAPSWDQIGKLAAIAVIRTGLNYFLEREVRADHAPAVEGVPPPARERANLAAPS
ncbi:MAG TPA: DUF1622 domain-containing protein [Anaeromyxobacteraceae bacterium]|nr:DUF1622 domain-containing protein [Anaeromyxobacteraceae bacterium]